MLDTPGAEALLERVEQANLFLVALDEEGEWFRYQALFAEYAEALLEPGAAAGLHRRAAGWFRERGLIEEAVEQYAAAGEEPGDRGADRDASPRAGALRPRGHDRALDRRAARVTC